MKIIMACEVVYGYYHNSPSDYSKGFGSLMFRKWDEHWQQEFEYLLEFTDKLVLTIRKRGRIL